MEDPDFYESRFYKKRWKNKRVSENRLGSLQEWNMRPTTSFRPRGGQGDGMLRNKVGIKKMMTDGELGAFISHV